MKLFTLLLLLTVSAAKGETYSHYFTTARDTAGASVSGATVAVYAAGTTSLSVIYSDDIGTLKGNPFLTDSKGNADFWVVPGQYKLSITHVSIGSVTIDDVLIGTQPHAASHETGGSDPLDLSQIEGTLPDPQPVDIDGVTNPLVSFVASTTVEALVTNNAGTTEVSLGIVTDSVGASHLQADSVGASELADDAVVNANVAAGAAIAESKLALNFATHSNANDPTSGQKAALAGSYGTPGGANKYVTDTDPRNTNSRAPTVHAASHGVGQSDEVTLNVSQVVGEHAGTDLTADLEEETHATEHQNGGVDEISVEGLSGELADVQKVAVQRQGVAIGTRSTVNLIEGDNVSLTIADNAGQDRVDVTVASTAYLNHAAEHELGGSDELTTENLATPETNTSLALKPDGVGGVAWGTAGGNAFATANAPAGTDPVADAIDDTLNFVASGNLSITGDETTDTLTFDVPAPAALAANGANCSAGSGAGGTNASGAAEDCTDYVAAGAVTSGELTMATARLLGRTTASTGTIEEISVGSGLSLSGGSLTALAPDHGALSGLTDDDHSQYVLAAGRGSSQTIDGGTGTNQTLYLRGSPTGGNGAIVALSDIFAGSINPDMAQIKYLSTPPQYAWGYDGSTGIGHYGGNSSGTFGLYSLGNEKLAVTASTVTLNVPLLFEGTTPDDFETTLTVVDPTADRTITLPNVTGTVVTTGDTGTVTGTMILNDTVNLGTDTTGGYLQSLTGVSGITVTSGTGEGVDSEVGLDYTSTLGGNPPLTGGTCSFSTTGIICEGSTADTVETLITVADPTSSDKTITLPNETGTVCTTGSVCSGYQASTTAGRSLTFTGATIDADAELYTQTKCMTLDSPSDADNFLFFRAETAITVTGIDCLVNASTSAVVTVQECNSNGGSCTSTEAAITCGTTNTTEATSIDDSAIDAGDWTRIDVGTVTGSVGHVSVCVTYTVND